MSLRTLLFWLHLLVGVTAGAVILFMSVTGVILTFEPQITDWLERDRRIITPPPDARPLSAEAILARAREARPDVRPTALTLRADPSASAVVSFGREGGALFVDQYRGVALGGLSPAHDALHEVVEWHRWLGSREQPPAGHGRGQPGLPRARGGRRLPLVAAPVDARGGARPSPCSGAGLGGRARDFNWHNVIGIWCAPVLLVLTLTGAIMSYQWANNLLYTPDRQRAPAAAGPRRGRAGRAARASDASARPRPRPGARPRGSTRSGPAPSARCRAGSPSTPGCRSDPMRR